MKLGMANLNSVTYSTIFARNRASNAMRKERFIKLSEGFHVSFDYRKIKFFLECVNSCFKH